MAAFQGGTSHSSATVNVPVRKGAILLTNLARGFLNRQWGILHIAESYAALTVAGHIDSCGAPIAFAGLEGY